MSLKYIDETDKSFGLAGMAISLVAWDAENWLDAINIDAGADSAMQMSADYYLHLAPAVGAKAVWEHTCHRFQITTAMTVANLTCRQLTHLGHSSIPPEIDSELRSALAEEGDDLCALEPDEVSRIYGKSLAYCMRLFAHPAVNELANNLAEELRTRRTLSAAEVFEILAPLNRM